MLVKRKVFTSRFKLIDLFLFFAFPDCNYTIISQQQCNDSYYDNVTLGTPQCNQIDLQLLGLLILRLGQIESHGESVPIERIARAREKNVFFFEVSLLCILWGLVNIDFTTQKVDIYQST